MRKSFARTALAVLTLLVMLVQGTWVLAGTTGGLSGTVTDASTGKAIAGASIAIASPSQSAKATTDQNGRFGFVSLAPDTYSLAITAPGYTAFSQAGITVIADQTTNYSFTPTKNTIAEIGRTRSRSATDLVKPGQTADVYSISGQLSQNVQSLGGGGNLFQTYSALQSVPGVYVPQGASNGQNTTGPYIRGGDYNQVGFEYDGIPVNRAFDNYVTNTQGITGQQELQVYTGGVPASSAGEGLSGYINQVIRTGTYPSTANAEGVLGTPAFYHYLRGEYGGATPSRNFSYYVGSTGWNQSYRYGNQANGGSGINDLAFTAFPNFGVAPDGNPYGLDRYPFNSGGTSDINTRETTANVHIGLPHHNGDGGRDDIQILGSVGYQLLGVYDSLNDQGGPNSQAMIDFGLVNTGRDPRPYPFPTTRIYNGPIFSGFDPTKIQTYSFPFSNGHLTLDPNQRGTVRNNNGIFKVQYQKNLGSSAYIRLYGYTNYSDWLQNDAPAALGYVPFTIVGSGDYELSTHTRGVSLDFADQLNAHHLLQGSAAYTFANVTRANNSSWRGAFRIQLRDGNGNCYSPTTGALSNCYNAGTVFGLAGGFTPATYTGTLPAVTGAAAGAGAAYTVASSGYGVTFNTVQPKFAAFSLTDDWQVSDKLKLTFGARYNSYIYGLADTAQQALTGGSNALLFTNFNQEHCWNAARNTFVVATAASGFTCPAGTVHPNISNTYPGSVSATSFEPRVGGTFSVSPYDVLRFSAGKYSQPSNSAFVQYNRAGDLASYTGQNFYLYGFNTPRHNTGPQFSYNYDLSYEKRMKNVPISFSLTPFLRQTKQQQQQFYLDPATNFVSGLNVGTLRAFGYEFLARYGDFNRDGMSGQVSFAYTKSKIRYENFGGSNKNLVDLINSTLIPGYNALTAAGGGSPCYSDANATTPGTPLALVGGACPVGSVANPYFGAPMQPGLDRNGEFSPYTVAPAAAGGLSAAGSSNSYEVPEVATFIVQYRHKGLRIVPTVQWDSGFRYSSPYAWIGYDPSSGACTANDTAACVQNGGVIFRPNPYTGRFDSLGQWQSPSTLALHGQIAYDINKRTTVTAILSNIYRHCFSRGYAWEQGGSQACGYAYQAPPFVGGTYLGNGTTSVAGSSLARIQRDPFAYAPGNFGLPFNAFLSLQVKM